MNKRDVLTKLSNACLNANIHRGSVTIVGGGASVILGLRTETADIDTHVDEDTKFDLWWNSSVKQEKDYLEVNHMPRCQHFSIGEVSFIYSDLLANYPTFTHRKFKVLTKLGLLMYRIDLGRSKDMADIHALENEWVNLNAVYTKRLKVLIGDNNVLLTHSNRCTHY